MGAELGRISGPMLKDNLLRNGVDLVFQNDLSDNLLYLDVNTSKIGINTDAATRELTVNDSIKTTDLIVDNQLTAANVTMNSLQSQISTTYGDLYINTAPGGSIIMPVFKTDNFKIYDNNIDTYLSNSDIEFSPHSLGKLVTGNTDVTGDLHSTGDITLDGNITFGNSDTDTVTFDAEVTSDIIPDADALYSLGTETKKWLDVRSKLVNGEFLTTGDISYPSITSIVATPGKTWFVAVNGSDANAGQHENNPLASINSALSRASAGDTVFIYPGTYTEIFPLIVPAGVSVKGPSSLRSVNIVPTEETKYYDCFLLNGGATVSNITVKDFYYDNVNDTGYAFRFPSVYQVTSRSPYVQNCSVITKGSVITPEDPRGYDSHDAGKGALVDGSVAAVENTSIIVVTSDTTATTADNMYLTTDESLIETYSGERSMLFHSVTFITPGVEGLTMTSGVRVEWLNSFTYFCSKGLYATNGIGRLTDSLPAMPILFAAAASGGGGGPPPLPGLTTIYGAELRSIGSANVYGEYGAVADGDETLMYLIQHNFAYIGTGKDSNNDNTLVVQPNETVEYNSGKIYYQSIDQRGNFRVGKAFVVDQETGFVTLNGLGQNVTGINQIVLSDGTNLTFIDATRIDQDNIRIAGNTISSLEGPINVKAFNNVINLNQNISITKDLAVTGNFALAGQINIGNQTIDSVSFNADFVNSILPKTTVTHNIGSSSLKWNNTYYDVYKLENITIADNRISTTVSNSNLELAAAGVGKVDILSLQADQNLTVEMTSSLKNISITGLLDITGDTTRSGTYQTNGTYALSGGLTTTSNPFSFGNIVALDNQLTTIESNSDLELRASGSLVKALYNDVEIDQDLYVGLHTQTVNIENTNTIEANVFDVNTNMLITGNSISAQSTLNLNLAAVSGIISVPTNNVIMGQQLVVDVGNTNLKNTDIQGLLDIDGNTYQTGNKNQTGNLDLSNAFTVSLSAKFGNVSFVSNSMSGYDIVPTNSKDLILAATGDVRTTTNNLVIDKNLTVTGSSFIDSLNNSATITADKFFDSDILITGNVITTTLNNNDLELYAHGSGVIRADDSFTVDNTVTINGTTNLQSVSLTDINQTGDKTQTGSITFTGDRTLYGDYTVSNNVFFTDISVTNNVVTTTSSNADLELVAAGTGNIFVPSNNVRINNTLTVLGTTYLSDINNSATVTANTFYDGDIRISENFIETTLSSSTLELRGNLLGGVKAEKIKINDNVLSAIDTNASVFITPYSGKNLILNTDTALKLPIGPITYGNANVTSTLGVDYTNASWEASLLKITNPSAFLIYLFSYLTPGSTFTGQLAFKYAFNDAPTITNPTVTVAGAITNVGTVYTIPLTTVPGVNYYSAIFNTMVIFEPQYNRTGVVGELRFSNTTGLFEGWENTSRPLAGVYSSDRKTKVTAGSINDLNFVTNNNLSMDINSTRTRVNSLLVSGNLDFTNNTISAKTLNSDVNLFANGSGETVIDDLTFIGNEIRNYSNSPLIIAAGIPGHVKMDTPTAIVMPRGTSAERPSSPEIGMMRYNTELSVTEVFNGVDFVGLAGNSQAISLDAIQELNEIYSLILG